MGSPNTAPEGVGYLHAPFAARRYNAHDFELVTHTVSVDEFGRGLPDMIIGAVAGFVETAIGGRTQVTVVKPRSDSNNNF